MEHVFAFFGGRGVSLEVCTLFKEDTLGENRDTLKLIELLFNHFSLALFGVSGCCHQCGRRILWKRKFMSSEILTEFSIGIFLILSFSCSKKSLFNLLYTFYETDLTKYLG